MSQTGNPEKIAIHEEFTFSINPNRLFSIYIKFKPQKLSVELLLK